MAGGTVSKTAHDRLRKRVSKVEGILKKQMGLDVDEHDQDGEKIPDPPPKEEPT